MRARRTVTGGVAMSGVVALALAPAPQAGAGIDTIVVSTEEAIARGVVYEMMPSPQAQGLLGFGCGFSDLDADNDQDIIILGAADGHVGIFENNGAGFFTDRSATSGIPLLVEASGFAAGDLDGDGLPELFITQMGAPDLLLRNDGNLQFTDIAALVGTADVGSGMGVSIGDYDADTRLDIYVCNYNGQEPGTEFMNNRLYRNVSDWSFAEVGAALGVDDDAYAFQSVWFDMDQDGDLDLYLSNDRGHIGPLFRTNQLWRNDGGVFENISAESGAGVALFSMGIACGDFDGNGWADLYVTNLASYEDGFNPLLLHNGATPPHYNELSALAGVDHWITSWGSIFYDFDNNGHQDLYVNNMFEANTLYLTDGSFPCVNLTPEAGLEGNTGDSFSSAVADIDRDGDLDLLMNNLGANVELYINNDGSNRGWVRFNMVGEGENVHGVGGRTSLRTGSEWQMREIMAGGNGYLGQNELTMHYGVGDAPIIDTLIATWPGGQVERTLSNLPINRMWTLYPPSALGDANGDGMVLLDDFFVLLDCADGSFQPGCEMMDFDGSSAVDAADAAAFVAAYDGDVYDCDTNGSADLIDIFLDPLVDMDGTGIPDACEAAGDLDGDGFVGTTDFLMLLAAWGPCGAVCPADLDGDGFVGTTDFLMLLAGWG